LAAEDMAVDEQEQEPIIHEKKKTLVHKSEGKIHVMFLLKTSPMFLMSDST